MNVGQSRFHIQLVDRPMGMQTGPSIIDAGGMVLVTLTGSYAPATLVDINSNAIANPVPLTLGSAQFYMALLAAPNVDLYVMAPNGQFAVLYNVGPDAINEVPIDRSQVLNVARIPFTFAQGPAGTEFNTGIVMPANSVVLPDVGVLVTTAETAGAKTMSVGLLSSQSGGNATGYINAISTANLGYLPAQSQATTTRGALIGAGTLDKGNSLDIQTAKNISFTIVAASVAVAGQIILPYLNLAPNSPRP